MFGGGLLYSASHHKQPQVKIRVRGKGTSGVCKVWLPVKLIGRRCVSRVKCEPSRRIALAQSLAGSRQRGAAHARIPCCLAWPNRLRLPRALTGIAMLIVNYND